MTDSYSSLKKLLISRNSILRAVIALPVVQYERIRPARKYGPGHTLRRNDDSIVLTCDQAIFSYSLTMTMTASVGEVKFR